MIAAAVRALSDIFSSPFRTVLWKALGLTILLFAAVFVAVEVALSALLTLPWPWLDTLTAVIAGLGLIAAFIFLMAPVTAIFAGLYLDEIAALVERRSYPEDPPGAPLNGFQSFLTGMQFGLLVLAVNLLTLPALFFGIGVVVMVIANAYLLGREYFEMIAMRHLSVEAARAVRRENAGRVFAAGFLPALLSLVPFVNLWVPLFATAYFVHIFKRIAARNDQFVGRNSGSVLRQ